MLNGNRNPLWYRADPRQTIRDLPGVGSRLAPRIIDTLGEGSAHAALACIERNPYRLIDVDGLGWGKADKIALQVFGIHSDDVRRHEAGNRYVLQQKYVLDEPNYIAERAKLELRDPAHQHLGVVVEDGRYWLPEELEAELGLEQWLRGVPTLPAELPDLAPVHREILDDLGLDEIQAGAVHKALNARVLCLTGGAGCGKTHVVAALSRCLLASRRSVRGMAFAGKAADRMREQFERYRVVAPATTIHKALGFMGKGFSVEMLAEDLIVIDEASMLPNWLLWAVVKRLKPGAVLILVGDPNQLPPIGYGTPFVDAIRQGVPRAHLERNYRQADQQGILRMAEGILHRSRPAPAECVEMHLGVDQSNLDALFKQLVRTHGGQNFEDWQVITYQNETVEHYNLLAQEVVNPNGVALFEYPLWKLGKGPRGAPLHHAELRVGDKILITKNNATLGIFNGQLGRVMGAVYEPRQNSKRVPVRSAEYREYLERDGIRDAGEQDEIIQAHEARGEEVQLITVPGEPMRHLRVEIAGRNGAVDIPEDLIDDGKQIQLGYVITVHKAQGSDWPRVIVMQPGKVRDDTARRFFYTAVTRAKDHLCIVSTLRAVAWWTNAAADAPDEPSSLMQRLARPAPEPVVLDIRPEFVPAAELMLGVPVMPAEEQSRAAYQQLADGLQALASEPDPWEGDEPVYWPEHGSAAVAQPVQPVAQAPAPVAQERIEEIKQAFRLMDLEVA